MRLDGGTPVRLTTRVLYDFQPVWSPDGAKIAFHRLYRKNHDGDIFVMNADGSDLVQLTTGTGENPTWAPNG